MADLRTDLVRLLALVPFWHGSKDGKHTPMARTKEGGACAIDSPAASTFCLCGMVYMAQSKTPDPKRVKAMLEALHKATGCTNLGPWSDAKGRKASDVQKAIEQAIRSTP